MSQRRTQIRLFSDRLEDKNSSAMAAIKAPPCKRVFTATSGLFVFLRIIIVSQEEEEESETLYIYIRKGIHVKARKTELVNVMAMEKIILNDSSPLERSGSSSKILNHWHPLPPEGNDGEAIDGRHVETLREQNLILKLISV